MQKSIFDIPQMDCPSEENLIRMKLDSFSNIRQLDFDLAERKLTIFHQSPIAPIEQSLTELDLGAQLQSTEESTRTTFAENTNQRKLLWIVLSINFIFFILEMTTGLLSKSMGLVADSLDMLADSFVYGISLFAVGGSLVRKKRVATLAGYFQIALAVLGFVEVLRRFFGIAQLPNFSIMIGVSFLALLANGVCLYLLQKSKSKTEAHMQASMIFTSNDIIINVGVMLTGVLVYCLESNKPDLIIGTVIFVLVIRGALRILKLGK